MSNREPKLYINKTQIKHVVFSVCDISSYYTCKTCGEIPVIDGTVVHTRPSEEHEEYFD